MKKKKGVINNLEDKGIVGKWPPRWVPFFLAGAFALLGNFSEKLALDWGGKLYFVAWFSLIWGILHLWIVRKLKN